MDNKAGDFYVSPEGDDANPGSREQPFATLSRAKSAVNSIKANGHRPVTVLVREGIYYHDQSLVFIPEDSGTPTAPITYAACSGEDVILSGGRRLDCDWKPYGAGIWMCALPDAEDGRLDFTQLFVNGKRQIRARYPNADDSDPRHHSGYIRASSAIAHDVPDPCPHPDQDMTFTGEPPRGITFDPITFTRKRWAQLEEAVIHIFQAHYWGNLQWHIKDIDWDQHRLWFGRGGQQISTYPEVSQASHYFVENVLEELDASGEWYLDKALGLLYYMPPEGLDLKKAVVEIPVLQQIFHFVGSQAQPVQHIHLKGFHFAHTTATFMEDYCVPSRSDWSIHRGGAVFLESARDCVIENCWFDAVGGNAVFLSGYNRRNTVSGCKFVDAGDSAICLVGHSETTVGSQKRFPYECRVENNLIHNCGIFGKQIAGVYISRAKRITVSHNDISQMPRAGICIGDGTWGGHVIEYNHIRNTCIETSDHGPFNSWGRDSYWCFAQSHFPYTTKRSHDTGDVSRDTMEPVIIRHNFFEERSGWGIDLDDGSSNFEIYNNLCLGVSIKLREGAHRTIYNNIWVNCANAPSFHVGYEANGDRYFRNITVMRLGQMKPEVDANFTIEAHGEVYSLIAPPAHGPWLEEIDHNCFFSDLGEFVAWVEPRIEGNFDEDWKAISKRSTKRTFTLEQWQALGFDRHSMFADPLFVAPENKDYRLQPESPALSLGFVSFDAREAGLTAAFPAHFREDSEVEATA